MKTSQHHPSVKYINQTVAAHAEMLKRGNLTTETIAESCRIKRNNLEAKYKFLNEIHSTKPTSITLSTPVKYDDNACQVQQTKIDAAINTANILNKSQLPSLPSLSLPFSYSLKPSMSKNTIKTNERHICDNQSTSPLNVKRPTSECHLQQKLEQLKSKCHHVLDKLEANRYSAESLKDRSMLYLKKSELNASLIGTNYSELDLVWYMDKKEQTQSEKDTIIKHFTQPKPISYQKGSRIPLKIATTTKELNPPKKEQSIHQTAHVISSHYQGTGRVIINGQVKRGLTEIALSPCVSETHNKADPQQIQNKGNRINHTKNISTQSSRKIKKTITPNNAQNAPVIIRKTFATLEEQQASVERLYKKR
ncbi:hypothetical protein MXZ96_07355 [Providencia stuartii]|uniref:hypothetical protein n=1 Tax=Providencia TaxID=586 RepID=UPI001FF10473|nr:MULTISPECIES: hypothetical protein [Providencia]MCK1143167.1 hypothetical protein [Providencia stuartii]